MATRYYVSYKPTNGQPENFTDFGSALARSLFIISLGGRAEIVRQWEASQTETEPQRGEAQCLSR